MGRQPGNAEALVGWGHGIKWVNMQPDFVTVREVEDMNMYQQINHWTMNFRPG